MGDAHLYSESVNQADAAPSPRVLVEQPDGSLRPIETPAWLITNAEHYLALRRRGLDHEAIRFVWEAGYLR